MKSESNRFAAVTAVFLVALAAVTMLCGWSGVSLPPCEGVAAELRDDPNLCAQLRALAARSARGDAEATFEFARRVELGIGTDPDPAEAAWWYEIAEEQGYTLPEDVVERLFP